jgi:hypothetical protein
MIVLIALVLYWPATSAWFFQDDLQWLAGTLTFTPGSLLDFAAQRHFYRPVISLYFWAATPLFGGSPVLFHWANSTLHAANGLLVLALARAIGFTRPWSFAAAVFFVSMPAYVEAIAWVSALAEPVTTFFGILSVIALLRARREGSFRWKLVSIVAFFMALITHESSVVLLPLLLIADLAFATPAGDAARPSRDLGSIIRRYAPYLALVALYLILDLSVNRRSYLVEEGHYRVGVHAIGNLLAYVITLYVGERNLPSYIAVTAVIALLLARGTPRVRFATAWLLLSILPFSFFTWSNTSRYAYMPAVGMALLLADALTWVDARLARAVNTRARVATVSVLAAFIAIRFMLFAAENIENFAARTEPYRQFAAQLRQAYPVAQRSTHVAVDQQTADALQYRYVEALARWELRDPTVTIAVHP